jgi:undecaprenyl-diphosphatase
MAQPPKKKTSPVRKNKAKPASTNPPEQQLGDTPVTPWEMPTAAEKEQAQPVKRALKEAVKQVGSQQKADEVIEGLESASAGQSAEEVEQQQPGGVSPEEAADKVRRAARSAPPEKKSEKVLEETARAVTSAAPREREAVSEAVQEVLNPEQQGAPPTIANSQQREFLRRAVLKRLKPLDAVDASLFLKVNHLPHTRFLNLFFYGITMAYKGGAAWYIAMALAGWRSSGGAIGLLRDTALPMAISSSIVEFPIKSYFRRRRPFITIIQAIVIGKKPGSWSFPSGHSAAAFAGAWLLSRRYPRWSPLTYLLAGLVGFSRMYLGDHYPGDVLSGSASGVLLAMVFNRLFRSRKRNARRDSS